MAYERSSYHRKWWVKTIRERNYFGHRYWWFNWSLLLGCIIAFYFSYNYLKEDTDQTCLNRNNLSRRIDGINDALDDCCACTDSVLVNSPQEDPPQEDPPIPDDAEPCNTQVVPGQVYPGQSEEHLIYLGPTSGPTVLRYDMKGCCDYVKVEYNGRTIASSNCEFHDGRLTFNYEPVNGNYTVKVTITGGRQLEDGETCDGLTHWDFTIDCPN
jgi:hypothetical protein